MVQQTHEITISFFVRISSGHEDWLLECCCRTSPVHVLSPFIPREVADGIEQPSSGRAAFLKVVLLSGVDLQLPEMVVLLRRVPVIDPRELATDAKKPGWFDATISLCLGIKDPADSIRGQFVPLLETFSGGVFWWEEEEYVVVSYCEIEYNVAIFVLVTAGNMAVETWIR
jgi:hypothetical protein